MKFNKRKRGNSKIGTSGLLDAGGMVEQGGMKSSQKEEQERAAWPRADASLVFYVVVLVRS